MLVSDDFQTLLKITVCEIGVEKPGEFPSRLAQGTYRSNPLITLLKFNLYTPFGPNRAPLSSGASLIQLNPPISCSLDNGNIVNIIVSFSKSPVKH